MFYYIIWLFFFQFIGRILINNKILLLFLQNIVWVTNTQHINFGYINFSNRIFQIKLSMNLFLYRLYQDTRSRNKTQNLLNSTKSIVSSREWLKYHYYYITTLTWRQWYLRNQPEPPNRIQDCASCWYSYESRHSRYKKQEKFFSIRNCTSFAFAKQSRRFNLEEIIKDKNVYCVQIEHSDASYFRESRSHGINDRTQFYTISIL